MRATFRGKKKLTSTNIYNFSFQSEEPLNFIAGQFTEIDLGVAKHWFTISSKPDHQLFNITTRKTDSVFKQSLFKLQPGHTVQFAEPMGDFVLPKNPAIPLLMVAAGIGITPYLSILGDLQEKVEARDMRLIYAATTANDFVDTESFHDQLADYQEVIGNLKPEILVKKASALDRPYIYLSGPEKLVENLTKQVIAMGLESSRVITDYFPGYD